MPVETTMTEERPDSRDGAAMAPNLVWVAMTALVFAYIWKYGRNFPFMEDWELVPTLSGASARSSTRVR